MMYSFEFNDKYKRLEIHGDSEGFLALADYFTHLANQQEFDSIDLMVRSWGGEMEDEPQGERVTQLLSMLKFVLGREPIYL